MRTSPIVLTLAAAIGLATGPTAAQPTNHPAVSIDRDDYADRLEAFWLAQCIANWTGRITEGAYREPPFPTDADWGGLTPGGNTIDWIFDFDPWPADDDTDIEYVFINELAELGTARLTPAQLRQAWIDHINEFIFVANARARQLMDRGVAPPATGLPVANSLYLRIDAQLTTEVFGALAPGLPHAALDVGDLFVETTARGHAAHASRFHIVLYALAPIVDPQLTPEQQIRWMVEEARRYIPDTSKAADIIDTVYADYLANPDSTDWERTRDLVYDRYQLNDDANGWRYQGWTESSVNFAAGLIALLYGQGNFPETVRIGTLSGWDSDNGTATMGALIGLLVGTDELLAQIEAVAPGQALSSRYWVNRTRDNMPDYLPGDPEAEDTFPMLAQRMLPIVDRVMTEAGAITRPDGWTIPAGPRPDPATASPAARRWIASANNTVRRLGGSVSTSNNAIGEVRTLPNSSTSGTIIGNGAELDDSGEEPGNADRQFYASRGANNLQPGDDLVLEVNYSLPVAAERLRLIEGDHETFGGWLIDPTFEVLADGVWTTPAGTLSEPFDPNIPFQIIDFVLSAPADITGVRLTGGVGGTEGYGAVAELDVLANTDPPPWPIDCPGDVNGDGAVSDSDFFAWVTAFIADPRSPEEQAACDVNRDGSCSDSDFFSWVTAFIDGC